MMSRPLIRPGAQFRNPDDINLEKEEENEEDDEESGRSVPESCGTSLMMRVRQRAFIAGAGSCQ